MKAADLREKTREDLLELQKVLARDVFRNRLKNFTNRLDDTSAVRKTRRDLARVLTLLRQGRATVSEAPVTAASRAQEAPEPAPAKRDKKVEARPPQDAPTASKSEKAGKAAKAAKTVAGADPAANVSRTPAAAEEGARPRKPAAKKGEAKER